MCKQRKDLKKGTGSEGSKQGQRRTLQLRANGHTKEGICGQPAFICTYSSPSKRVCKKWSERNENPRRCPLRKGKVDGSEVGRVVGCVCGARSGVAVAAGLVVVLNAKALRVAFVVQLDAKGARAGEWESGRQQGRASGGLCLWAG
jgi:hypothetical protein